MARPLEKLPIIIIAPEEYFQDAEMIQRYLTSWFHPNHKIDLENPLVDIMLIRQAQYDPGFIQSLSRQMTELNPNVIAVIAYNVAPTPNKGSSKIIPILCSNFARTHPNCLFVYIDNNFDTINAFENKGLNSVAVKFTNINSVAKSACEAVGNAIVETTAAIQKSRISKRPDYDSLLGTPAD